MINLLKIRRANLLYTFQVGYNFVQLPLGLFSFATTIYYLLVNNIPALKGVFPEFWMFLLTGAIVGGPTCLAIGQWYIQSPLNKASTRTHPYSQKLIPTQFALYESIALILRAEGYTEKAEEIERLVEDSRRQW